MTETVNFLARAGSVPEWEVDPHKLYRAVEEEDEPKGKKIVLSIKI